MASIQIKANTKLSPKQFITALTDFGPKRSSLWGNSLEAYFVMHANGANWAEVTEGSNIFGGVWERLRYDWSKPNRITLKTIDSNFWTNGSGWQYDITTAADGSGTTISYTITRFPKTIKAHFAVVILGLIGKSVLKRDFQKTLSKIEFKQRA
jgi:hypothetical protein